MRSWCMHLSVLHTHKCPRTYKGTSTSHWCYECFFLAWLQWADCGLCLPKLHVGSSEPHLYGLMNFLHDKVSVPLCRSHQQLLKKKFFKNGTAHDWFIVFLVIKANKSPKTLLLFNRSQRGEILVIYEEIHSFVHSRPKKTKLLELQRTVSKRTFENFLL